MKFSVSRQGETLGPFSMDEIVAKVRAKELELFDYIYDEAKSDWVLLMEFSALAEKLKSVKPPRPSAPSIVPTSQAQNIESKKSDVPVDAHGINEWFILKGEIRFGPFNYNDLVKMMQEKVVFPFDYLWHAGLKNWMRVAQFDEFKPEAIRDLFTKKENKALFTARQYKRSPFAGEVMVHDNRTLWQGKGVEISRGGVGLTMKNNLVVPGQRVTVHFKQHGDWPAFNAVCEVVSKKFVSDDSPVQFGLRFLSLSTEAQAELHKKVA